MQRSLVTIVAFCALGFVLAACGGSGTTVGGGANPVPGQSTAPGGGASGGGAGSGSGGGGTPAPSSSAPGTAGGGQSIFAAPTNPPQAPGYTNVVPPTPAKGSCRAGQTYSIYILTPTGDREAFTVFEPATLCGGQTYPLVMWGPGYSSSRETSTSSGAASALSPGNIGALVAANYGVVSIDERGFGEDSGTVRSMDPNYEGLMDLSVMDWSQANLNWIRYGKTLEGDDYEPVMGSIGGSYGGMYQMMLLDIDKRHRLQAIVPQIAPYSLNYSLYPNGVIKDAWDLILFGAGESGGSGISRGNEDPFLAQATETSIETNQEGQASQNFFGYHSDSYFCEATPIAYDGNTNIVPLFTPVHPPKVNAMVWNGMRDTLFTFNNAYNNYNCLKAGGGDVRLLSYQSGHNTLQAVPDPYMYQYYSPTDDLSSNCGSLSVDDATTAFFNQYLKMQPGAASKIPTEPCLSISTASGNDAVLVPTVTVGKNGTHYAIPATTAVAGGGEDVPIAVPLGPAYTAAATVGGLPHMALTVTATAATGEPILFFGIGQTHASQPGNYDLLDNQLTPIRGAGLHDLDMTGIAARVQPGDQLYLLIYGGEDQYDASGDVNAAKPSVVPVSISGDLWLPLLANPQTAP